MTEVNFREQTQILRVDADWGLEDLLQAKKQLEEHMIFLDEDISSIRDQLAIASNKKFTDGVWADPDWWRRANTALRHKGRQRQSYQTTLGELNRRIRAVNAKNSDRDDARMFISCAKKLLPESDYEAIWTEVRRRLMEQ